MRLIRSVISIIIMISFFLVIPWVTGRINGDWSSQTASAYSFISTAGNPVVLPPDLPSTFYGEALFNGKSVPAGTLIKALIDGTVVSEGYISNEAGNSIYSIDIKSNTPGAVPRDGGNEGDIVEFSIGGKSVSQKGIWHSGTMSQLDLILVSGSWNVFIPIINH